MKMDILKMEIKNQRNGYYEIQISKNDERTIVKFNPIEKNLQFIQANKLSKYLKENEYQFRKLLHNKRIDTYYIGFKLTFAFRDKKDVASFNDRSNIVVLDKRDGQYESYVIKSSVENIPTIYTDGSYNENTKTGGYGIVIEKTNGDCEVFSGRTTVKGSSQVELESCIKAIELLEDVMKIRIVTDSQYVRKGLTEWTPYWKLNDWKTANGEDVKNKELWMRFDKVTAGKYIEFLWVKGHSGHEKNTECDRLARIGAGT
ncbi:MAG: ribonuclease HI [Firmicutes bacterium]|jgi:ribonuclease HI|nr:ribonuclease HI [Bacillota bacterium]